MLKIQPSSTLEYSFFRQFKTCFTHYSFCGRYSKCQNGETPKWVLGWPHYKLPHIFLLFNVWRDRSKCLNRRHFSSKPRQSLRFSDPLYIFSYLFVIRYQIINCLIHIPLTSCSNTKSLLTYLDTITTTLLWIDFAFDWNFVACWC